MRFEKVFKYLGIGVCIIFGMLFGQFLENKIVEPAKVVCEFSIPTSDQWVSAVAGDDKVVFATKYFQTTPIELEKFISGLQSQNLAPKEQSGVEMDK